MNPIDTDLLGTPDITLAGLKLWIERRQFEDTTDYWDANWLIVTLHCSSAFAQAVFKGPIIHLSELERWRSELEKLDMTLRGEARLNCMEPELSACILLDRYGSGSLKVDITPDNRNERHEFTFAFDQSYLPKLISELDAIQMKYPIKGTMP